MSVYLFDFDGTLVNSMSPWRHVIYDFLDEQHISYGPDFITTTAAMGYPKMAEYCVQLGCPMTVEETLEELVKRATKMYQTQVFLKENVYATLLRLREEGHSLNILSGGRHSMMDPCMELLGIYHWFDHVWSCEDFDTVKTDPTLYERVAQQLGVPVDQVLYFDDNQNAVRAAKAASMTVCGVYEETGSAYWDEICQTADFTIRNFSELPTLPRPSAQ